jgi:hypothetical protein
MDPAPASHADDRDSDGLADILAAPAPDESTAPATATAPVAVATTEEPRADRVSEAVKLTGQALHAWLSVLQAPAVALHEPTHSRTR